LLYCYVIKKDKYLLLKKNKYLYYICYIISVIEKYKHGLLQFENHKYFFVLVTKVTNIYTYKSKPKFH